MVKETTTLEKVLDEGQASKEEVSEQENIATTDEKPVEETAKAEEGGEETPDAFDSRVQAEVDTRTNTYREKREADTAFIRTQADQLKELNAQSSTKRLSKAAETVLAGDDEEGLASDKIEARRKALDEIKDTLKGYNEKSAEVEETAALATSLSETIGKDIANQFDLHDSNPSVRAKGVISLISDAVHFVNERTAFNRILDEIPLLKKGEEVRKQIDGFIERYMELSDQKGKDLLINQLKQEFKIAPRKKPPAPTDSSGGGHLSDSNADKVTRGLEKLTK